MLKIILVVLVGLQGLFYALENLFNLDAAHGAVAAVMSMAGQTVYPHHYAPAITSPAITWLALAVIIAGELLVAALCLRGAWGMTAALRASAEQFQRAKQSAILGCGMALIVWFGFFMVFGSAFFQMWQTELGSNSAVGAFQYAMSSGLVMIFVAMHDI